MPRSVRRTCGVAAVAVSLVLSTQLIGGTHSANAAVTASTTPDTIYEWDLENEPSQCVGLLPRPDCGKAPTQAGDRGGALQFAVFGLIMCALGLIGGVIVRNVVRRDRAIADALRGAAPVGDDRPRP